MVTLDFDVIEGRNMTCTFWKQDRLEPGGLGPDDEGSFALNGHVVVQIPTWQIKRKNKCLLTTTKCSKG